MQYTYGIAFSLRWKMTWKINMSLNAACLHWKKQQQQCREIYF